MEVEVEVEAEAVLTGERRLTSTAYLVYVALDETGHPTPVPSLQVVSDDERRRAKEAERRRAERLARREVPHHGAPAAEDITGTSRGIPCCVQGERLDSPRRQACSFSARSGIIPPSSLERAAREAAVKHHRGEGNSIMETRLVEYRVEEGIAIIELSDPPANTYTYEMMRQLDDAILRARFDDTVHVLVVTGAGDRFFCAGANIRMLAEVTPQYKYYFCLHANETLNRLENTPKLVIAALNGHTVGGGLEIALACDIRIARKDSGKIGLPEVSLGVLPGTGGTQRLARLLGKARALELMVTGRLMTYEEALEIGLIHHIFPSENFMAHVLDYARQFLPPRKASRAVGHIKRAVQSGWEMSFHDGLALERELQQLLFQSEDAREGLTAYVEKREPRFQGR